MSTDPNTAASTAASTSRSAAGSADLGHLHPDTLRLGGAGVFAGDWAWTEPGGGTPPRIPTGFVGVLVDTWNGWAVFACTREVAEAIVADQRRLRDADRARLAALGVHGDEQAASLDELWAPMWFDGDDIVIDERAVHGEADAVTRIGPDSTGRYRVGWGWTWTAVDPADCDRIVGQIPARGEHQEFVMLVHTPDVRLPHDRVRVVSLQQMPTYNGVAYTAQVALDGEIVGTIENNGNGGPTTYYSLNSSPFNWRHLEAFVRQCRRRGQPVSEEWVLDALVDEFDLDQIVRQAAADGATVVRLLDEHGHQLDLRTVRPAPTSGAQRAGLAQQLRAGNPHPHGVEWMIWSGAAWRHLTRAASTTQTGTGTTTAGGTAAG